MKKNFLIITLLTLVLFACSPVPAPEQTNIETVVALTLQALTTIPIEPAAIATTETPLSGEPAATAINGTLFTDSALSFVIPPNIASSVTIKPWEESLPGEGIPWFVVHPAYVEYLLQGYPVGESQDTVSIYVYPIADYVAMNEDVATKIEILKSLIANPNQPLPERLPFLPTLNIGNLFHSNFEIVTFQNGSGIRYLSEFSQFPLPISNNGMFYTFQGITNDGLYYVSAILPINIGFLVGYPTPTDQGDFEGIQKQVELVTQQLNNSTPESFTPSMLTLDAMIQSITVNGLP